MQRRSLFVSLVLAISVPTPLLKASTCESNLASGHYLVGAAQADITGPIVGTGMLGYGKPDQVTSGLHMRLRSRALVVKDSCSGSPVALVAADLAMVFGGLKAEVLRRVNQILPGTFQSSQLLLAANHTHSGPGGFAHYPLYNITTLGFHRENFETIAAGIAQSIVQAHTNLAPRRLTVSRGNLPGLQFNRSPDAYRQNPEEERQVYGKDVEDEMIVLNAHDDREVSAASFNWFPVHGVSISLENQLVSGDNKGYAAYRVERKFGASYLKNEEYVAGFLQSPSGDVSPYPLGGAEPLDHGYMRSETSGESQALKVLELLQTKGESVRGPVRWIERQFDLRRLAVAESFTGSTPQQTCSGALGVSFAAGTENGRPFNLFREGMIYGKSWPEITAFPAEQECQKEKVVLLPTAFITSSWTAEHAPFQILQLGSLAVIGLPFELTTMAGRRLKERLSKELAPEGVTTVVLSTLANEYLHYLTTPEEFSAQHYEGGANLYGPWSLAASMQSLSELSVALMKGEKSTIEASESQSAKPLSLPTLPQWDTAPFGERFGAVKSFPKVEYQRGEPVHVEFWGAKLSRARRESFLEVQREELGSWAPIYYDWDASTILRWQRAGLTESIIAITWTTRTEDRIGSYRICHAGESRGLFGAKSSYQGCTAPFQLK